MSGNEPSCSGIKRKSSDNEDYNVKVSKSFHKLPGLEKVIKIEKLQSAFGGQTCTYRIIIESADGEISNAENFFSNAHNAFLKILTKAYENSGIIKAVFNLHGCLTDNQYEEFDISASFIICDKESIASGIQSARKKIVSRFNNDQDDEGDWELLYLDLHINRHRLAEDMYIEVPDHIKPYVIDMKSRDYSEESFKWAVLAALHPDVDPQDVILADYSDDLIMTDIEYPVKLDDIPKIEDMNKVSFNVFILKYNYTPNKRKEIEGPIYHTALRRNKHFNLLLLQDGTRSHYLYIKELKKLVNIKNNGIFCDGCLNFFDDITLEQHQKRQCLKVKIVYPPNEKITFEAKNDSEELPIVVYADFEAFLEPIESSDNKTKKKETYTKNVNKQVPYSFAYFMKCSNDELSQLRTYHGLDCAERLIRQLQTDITNVCKVIDKVTDVPVFFHNFSNYDSHFLSRALNAVPGKISGLGSKHNFIAIYKTLKVGFMKEVQLRFLDSCKFLKGSIETLANDLDPEKFFQSRRYWRNSEKFNLMIQKGSFPYEYIKCLDDLEEETLPPKESFYSSLKNIHISEEDYQRALRVWDLLECNSIRDYSEQYAKSDVLILADLFENLRRVCLETYGLDAAKYYGVPKLSWDAMLNYTGVELELLTNVEMLTFILEAKRSGIAHCTRRHAVANNKYLPDTYDAKKSDSFIMYYDANNLYGWAMSQPLPYSGFKWVKNCSVEWAIDKFSDFPTDSDIGYFLEVDLDYPDELHDYHADLPLCPEKKEIPNCKDKKLVTDLTDKKNYVLHHSYLIQCLEHGLVLKKVHRVLRFKQRPWLKAYIDYNTERRRLATSTVDKDFYKLMNNSIYGKSIENNEKYSDVHFVHDWFGGWPEGGHSLTGRADYHSHAVMAENLMVIQTRKTARKFDKPVYVGVAVYDLSKAYMYDFHYNYMKQHFKERLKLLYTDTDSFIYQILSKDYYSEIMDKLDERFDTSDYPDSSIYQSQQNKKKVGYFKDELNGDIVKEFVALRPKVYMIDTKSREPIIKASGVLKAFQNFTLDDYKTCLFEQRMVYKEMFRIKAVGYDLYTQKYRKVALSPAYTNRKVLDNLIDTLPFGHYSLRQE